MEKRSTECEEKSVNTNKT